MSVLPKLLGALSARGWIDFKTEITKVGSLLSQMPPCRWVVQNVKLRKLPWLLSALLLCLLVLRWLHLSLLGVLQLMDLLLPLWCLKFPLVV